MALTNNTTNLQAVLSAVNALPTVKQEQTKTATPSKSQQTITPDSGKTLSSVTVNAVPTETKTATANGTITPSSGKFLSQVTVSIPVYTGSFS